ncbi:MAG: carboxypeptidase-like regulatory domain-containing protein [Planctomycetaceae bacterium]|nr:carboxypeptidase-like regulatory domain-containing protein [Planctomycetaceae bacterium]
MPDNFPNKLTKFTVKLLHEGKPVEGASVALIAEDTTTGYLVIALTGSDGIAKLETSINVFSKSGVPSGTYKTVVTYRPAVPSDLTLEEKSTLGESEIIAREAKIQKELAALPKIIPREWGDIKTTPVRITVPENGGEVTIETTNPKTFES